MYKLAEFNEAVIPFALVGYEIGYSQIGPTGRVGHSPFHIQRALMHYRPFAAKASRDLLFINYEL